VSESELTLWSIAALVGVGAHLVALRYVNGLVSLSIGVAVAALIIWAA
jgi:hypothetical protein